GSVDVEPAAAPQSRVRPWPDPRAAAAPARYRPRRLDARPRWPAGARTAGRLLDHRWIACDHGRLVGGHRDLFRVPRRRADTAACTASPDAIRLRGPHRGPARAGRPRREPPVARSG